MNILDLSKREIEIIEDKLDAYDNEHIKYPIEGNISIGIKDEGNLVAGLDGCMTTFNIFYLSTLFVNKEYRRKGYGKALIKEMERRAKELEEQMYLAQAASSIILSLRRKVNIKVRQPLSKIMIPDRKSVV